MHYLIDAHFLSVILYYFPKLGSGTKIAVPKFTCEIPKTVFTDLKGLCFW